MTSQTDILEMETLVGTLLDGQIALSEHRRLSEMLRATPGAIDAYLRLTCVAAFLKDIANRPTSSEPMRCEPLVSAA